MIETLLTIETIELIKFVSMIAIVGILGYLLATQLLKILFPIIVMYDNRSNRIDFARKFLTIRKKDDDKYNETSLINNFINIIYNQTKYFLNNLENKEIFSLGLLLLMIGIVHDHAGFGSPGYGPIDMQLILFGLAIIGLGIFLREKTPRKKMAMPKPKKAIKKDNLPIGYYIKTSLFPLLQFDKLMLHKTEIKRKMQEIWIFTNNIEYNEEKRYFEPTSDFNKPYFETPEDYEKLVSTSIKSIGVDIADAIIGDPNLRKQKFEEAIPNPRGDKWKK